MENQDDNQEAKPTVKPKVKAYLWKPKSDIKVFELAKCLRFVINPICLDASLIDEDCLRHFEEMLG